MNIPPSSIAMNGHRPPVGGLFPSKFNVTESRFATSADPRGYIPSESRDGFNRFNECIANVIEWW